MGLAVKPLGRLAEGSGEDRVGGAVLPVPPSVPSTGGLDKKALSMDTIEGSAKEFVPFSLIVYS